ncbi:HD domain-containing protein [Lacihabitans soyangensis]|uniref:HD domain-containing protein n=1 Tax=Lacihabitans soyangensis TaxID=869394 RepID=A0AAE3GZY5_9BACT|nr:HD domain-containing protein [Lacihabitans soyangensis]MCP9761474.1 HD domain-containing protein [Lacihabitans soyangensis]
MTNKRKIFNDPIYGFITIPSDFIFEIVQHPYFQRLRRIKQLGMAELVYPGAFHSRFQHALGAMHLMNEALNTLQSKGLMIMEVEREAALVAILLHDIGHGPFSHVLEYAILKNVNHEAISELLMEDLNKQFEGKLTLAIEMFKGTYDRSFFHQLISSQLDMDRMDYLNRDSFYTGVAEGNIGAERIIKMLHVVDNQLVVEEKGLLSVENFLVARRLMYWQVYLHKTSICSETMVLKIFERVKDLLSENIEVKIPAHLRVFIEKNISKEDFKNDPSYLQDFVSLDDVDIWYALKSWQNHSDWVLANLSRNIIERNLFKIKIEVGLKTEDIQSKILGNLVEKNIPKELHKYFFKASQISNSGYASQQANIKILMKNGNILDVSEASDLPTIKAMSNIVKKNYICYTNDVYLPSI